MVTNKPMKLKKLIWQVPAFILLLIVMGNLTMLFVLKGEKLTGQMFLYGSINSVLVGGSFAIGLSLMVNMLDRTLPWLHFPLKRLIVQFFVTIGLSVLLIIAAILLTSLFWHQKITSDYFLETGSFMTKVALIFVFAGSLISNSVLFFKNWKESAVQQEKLKREQLALQYETLKSQVNPHFLFNNLNSLTSLISSNQDKAIDFVKKLSEVYRYILDQKDHELVDLETELKFLESYVFLQKIRFETNLDVQIDVSARNFKVIPLSIQMLVENAIKHNEISDKNPLLIRIYSDEDQYLTVENQLKKKSGSEGSGSGIQNIKDRYEFFTDKRVFITFNSERFRVKIPLLTT
jgi:sensor histidine kinase YesM